MIESVHRDKDFGLQCCIKCNLTAFKKKKQPKNPKTTQQKQQTNKPHNPQKPEETSVVNIYSYDGKHDLVNAQDLNK